MRERGFSLIQVTIVLAIIAIAMAATLSNEGPSNQYKQVNLTVERMKKIEEAIGAFRTAKQRLPCPADGTLALDNASFGTEALKPGICDSTNFITGTTVGGIVPVTTLQLPQEYALDGWGRRFTYVVDNRATAGIGDLLITEDMQNLESGNSVVTLSDNDTSGILTGGQTIYITGMQSQSNLPASLLNGPHTVDTATASGFTYDTGVDANDTGSLGCVSMTCGTIKVFKYDSACEDLTTAGDPYPITIDGDTPTTAMMVIISHGANGHGAFPARGSSVDDRINAGSIDAAELENASVNAGFTLDFNSTFSDQVHTDTYDDIVRYTSVCRGDDSCKPVDDAACIAAAASSSGSGSSSGCAPEDKGCGG